MSSLAHDLSTATHLMLASPSLPSARLLLVQNAAAHPLTNTCKREHITTVLALTGLWKKTSS